MPLAGFSVTFIDEAGNLLTGVTYAVRRISDNALANLFSDQDGTTPMDNGGTTGVNDNALTAYCIGGAYYIDYSKGSDSGTIPYVGVGRAGETDTGVTPLTSTTSLAIGTGTKVFTTLEGSLGWGIGARVRASSDADPATDFMVGLVTAVDDNEVTLSVDLIGGSGTHADWTLNLTGERGASGDIVGALTPYSLGTISTGTVTPDPADGAMQYYTNDGAHTLAELSAEGSIAILITNGASAGAITTSGWDFVFGDTLTTTNGHRFRCTAEKWGSFSILNIKALQ